MSTLTACTVTSAKSAEASGLMRTTIEAATGVCFTEIVEHHTRISDICGNTCWKLQRDQREYAAGRAKTVESHYRISEVCRYMTRLLKTTIESNQNDFQTRSLRGWERLKTDLPKWHWDKCFPHLVFYIYICLSVRRFAKRQNLPPNILHIVLSSPY